MRPEERVGAAIAKNLGYDDEKRRVIVYGLGALFQMLLLLAIALVFGLLFRCLPETMILFWGVGLMRRTTGGAHCETYLGCVMTSALSICLISLICRYMSLPDVSDTVLIIITGIVFLFSAVVFYRKVPMASPNKPIRRPEKIKRLRIECAITTVVYLCIAILFLRHGYIRCMYALLFVMLWMCFTLSSTSGRLVRFMDKLSDTDG